MSDTFKKARGDFMWCITDTQLNILGYKIYKAQKEAILKSLPVYLESGKQVHTANMYLWQETFLPCLVKSVPGNFCGSNFVNISHIHTNHVHPIMHTKNFADGTFTHFMKMYTYENSLYSI